MGGQIIAPLTLKTNEDLLLSTSLHVEGMSCQHCVANVKNSLEAVDGVVEATPDLESGIVQIKGSNLSDDALKQAVIDAGYRIAD